MPHTVNLCGRPFALAVNVWALERIAADAGEDLPALVAGKDLAPLGDFLADPVRFGRVLWALVGEQAQSQGLDRRSVLTDLAGDTLDVCQRALLEELADFSPSPEVRKTLRAVMAKTEEVGRELLRRAQAQLAAITPDSVLAASSASATRSPASSASTPAP